MKIGTLVVDGPLAFGMARLDAAEEGRNGLQILGLEGLAARLAGGFVRPATRDDVELAVASALDRGGLRSMDGVRGLPGMIRAASGTLDKLWRSGIVLDHHDREGQAADVAELDRRVRALFPPAVLAPPDLARAAMARVGCAPVLLGPVAFARPVTAAPVWRPLLLELARTLAMAGLETGDLPPPGGANASAATAHVVTCSDPACEAVEAVRWVRSVLASGDVRPRDVAIAACDTSPYDERMAALVAESGLPVHFSHGVPALATPAGQSCAALADLVVRGLSRDRVCRLLARLHGSGGPLADVPGDALGGLPDGPRLTSCGQWADALAVAAAGRLDGFDPRLLAPWIERLGRGSAEAWRLGSELLPADARELWTRALRGAPAEALETELAGLTVADGRDPGACAVWAPARHLAGAPRRNAMLLGLTAGSWPRRTVADALLPDGALGGRRLVERSTTRCDRDDFSSIAGAAAVLVLSRPKRSAQGRIVTPSPLLPDGPPETVTTRSTPARHAFSEADRLFSRPPEAAALPHVATALACTRARRSAAVTAHDGAVRADHPTLLRTLAALQSASSLTLLLRDPLAFAWRYALGWRSTTEEPQALSLDERDFGELVHEILALTVSSLEPEPGLALAGPRLLEASVAAAADRVRTEWRAKRATPLRLIWDAQVEEAAAMAGAALAADRTSVPGTRSWSEVAFGRSPRAETGAGSRPQPPWDPSTPVRVPGTDLRVAGSIDRLDLHPDGVAVRLTDYKTGLAPTGFERARLRGGAELQRVVYALAATSGLPQLRTVSSRLVYLAHDPPRSFRIGGLREAVQTLSAHLRVALSAIRSGAILAGPDARLDHNPFRLALPASTEAYFAIKGPAFERASGDLARVWRER